MRGYEDLASGVNEVCTWLRIPMRGYEFVFGLITDNGRTVTNPHAGL